MFTAAVFPLEVPIVSNKALRLLLTSTPDTTLAGRGHSLAQTHTEKRDTGHTDPDPFKVGRTALTVLSYLEWCLHIMSC